MMVLEITGVNTVQILEESKDLNSIPGLIFLDLNFFLIFKMESLKIQINVSWGLYNSIILWFYSVVWATTMTQIQILVGLKRKNMYNSLSLFLLT